MYIFVTKFQLESLLSTYHIFNYFAFIQCFLQTKYKSDRRFSRKTPCFRPLTEEIRLSSLLICLNLTFFLVQQSYEYTKAFKRYTQIMHQCLERYQGNLMVLKSAIPSNICDGASSYVNEIIRGISSLFFYFFMKIFYA